MHPIVRAGDPVVLYKSGPEMPMISPPKDFDATTRGSWFEMREKCLWRLHRDGSLRYFYVPVLEDALGSDRENDEVCFSTDS